jgi:hypothetical protein
MVQFEKVTWIMKVKKAFTIFNIIINILVLVIIFQPADAQQQKEVTHEWQTWLGLNNTFRIHQKWDAIIGLQANRTNFLQYPNYYLVSAGANFWWKDNTTFALFYTHKWTANSIGEDSGYVYANEDRFTQQAQHVSKLGNVSVQLRLRVEERWEQKIEDGAKTNDYTYSTRLRNLFGLYIPLFKNPMLPGLLISDEVLIQFGKSIVYNTFSQNRFNIGIRQKVSETVKFDLTYMNIYEQKPSGYQYQSDNTIRMFWYYTPDLRKQKTPPHMNPVEMVE